MELIRVYKKLGIRPKHTIRVVMYADEENGGAGSEKYAELAKAKNEKLLFALESDDGGFVPRGFRVSLEEEKIENLRKWLPLFYQAYIS
jgi:Zn-dependent M28 family amino/carboxypeptidase